MDPVTAMAVGAGASAVGGVYAADSTASSVRDQIAFQRMMYKNRYRFTVQDMRKAGLNPILAANLGGGSSPAGAAATINNPMAGVPQAMQAGAASAKEVQTLKPAVDKIKAETQATYDLADKAVQDRKTSGQLGLLYKEQRINQMLQNDALQATAKQLKQEAEFHLRNPSVYKTRAWASALGSILGGGNSAKSLVTK